jgi:hypothetical protein
MNSHVKIKEYFEKLHNVLNLSLGDYKDIILPFEGKSNKEDEWVNRFYSNKVFRHSHLEYYKTDRICVLHSNTFPNLFVDMPIMGFDLIALGDKITGIFFDFTPVNTPDYLLRCCLKDLKNKFKSPQRPLPEWANFFSEDFYCVSPLPEELDEIVDYISESINYYLETAIQNNDVFWRKNLQKQNEYCIGQKKNDKTFNALAAEIGKDNAKKFLDDYLFPEIDL